jgi:hypothetical protein
MSRDITECTNIAGHGLLLGPRRNSSTPQTQASPRGLSEKRSNSGIVSR